MLLGVGIASMHYVGMHGLSGHFAMTHDGIMVVLLVPIAIAAAHRRLCVYPARQGGCNWCSARSRSASRWGMHYTAMADMNRSAHWVDRITSDSICDDAASPSMW